MRNATIFCLIGLLAVSCVTTDLEAEHIAKRAVEEESGADTRTDEEILIDKIMAENDVEESVVYVAPPETREAKPPQGAAKKGDAAVKENWERRLVLPEFDDGVLRAFRYSPDAVFEILCQTYHITDIEFELGEQIIETPFCSETELWEIGTGTAVKDGQKQIHLMVKPSQSAMSSSFIVMTDRRTYHMELKSTKTHFMPVVRWVYPKKLEFHLEKMDKKKIYTELGEVEAEFISFDYKMKHNPLRRPSWLPKQVYDDGRRTYIVLDEMTLHTKMPALFDKSKNLINYRVKKNILICDQLIEKVTLKVGKEKVTIEKKKTRKDDAERKKAEKSDEIDARLIEREAEK